MLVLPRQSGHSSLRGKMDQGRDPDQPMPPHRHLVHSPYNVPVLPPLHQEQQHDDGRNQSFQHPAPYHSSRVAREVPYQPPRDSPRVSPREAPYQPSRDSPREIFYQSPRVSPREIPYQPPRDSPREMLYQSPRVSPREVPPSPQVGTGWVHPAPRPMRNWSYSQDGIRSPGLPAPYTPGLPPPIVPENNPYAAPDTIGTASRSGSVSNPYDDRKDSIGTAASYSTGDEQGKGKKKKRSSKLSDKVKSAVKDLFTRDDNEEPVTAIRRREADPWDDEDY